MTAAPSTADWNDIPVRDWEGRPIACPDCEHAGLQAAGGCAPGRSCMQDAYARRIDRFFRSHRELAARHLGHPYFEVRAIAARSKRMVSCGSQCTQAPARTSMRVSTVAVPPLDL